MGRYRPPTPRGSNYITANGEKSLRDELKTLWEVERPTVTAAVHEAAKNGDRSENGDYIYGKRRLREIDRRVRYLSKRLEELTVVDQAPDDTSKVYFGAVVTIEDEEGNTESYQIVGPDELDLATGRLSMDAPIARALLGRQRGDDIIFDSPSGTRELHVLNIDYSHLPDA